MIISVRLFAFKSLIVVCRYTVALVETGILVTSGALRTLILLRPLDVLTIGDLTRDFNRSMTLRVHPETKENLPDVIFVAL